MDANGRTEHTRSQSGAGRPRLRPRRDGVAKSGHEAGSGNDGLERRAIAAAKRGEWDAIHYLYVRYADDVLAYVRSILGDHHAAEDVTQNVFAKLMGAIQRYEERGAIPFAGWIMRVARNAALDYLRARRQIPVEEVRAADPGDEGRELEQRQCLKAALASLPSEQREVLVLRHLLGLSPPEIAARLERSESSVHGLHHRGRAALRAALIELEAAPEVAR